MRASDIEVAIIGGGAAGIAAARRLYHAGVPSLIIEARERLGGRAWTVTDTSGCAYDLGCGWLHSADRNPWSKIAKSQGRAIDETPPPWFRASLPVGFPLDEQREAFAAFRAFYERIDRLAEAGIDAAAATVVEPGCRWNGLIGAILTYISGGDLDRLSVIDLARYTDSGVNWRVAEGYGTVILAYGAGLPAVSECPVWRIDHRGTRLKIETAQGAITADRAIVTVPTALIAEHRLIFAPELPDKMEAVTGLPLGLADKLFLSLETAEEFEKDSRLFGRTDRCGTGAYHFRPFGRPYIEAYFGGALAAELEQEGMAVFFDFAKSELAALLGANFVHRIRPMYLHGWHRDPFARGSYSFAVPGAADSRTVLAAPVDDRLFFAGEACSASDFSTAHGAWMTGAAAADAAIAARAR